jgi:hypothetical protein
MIEPKTTRAILKVLHLVGKTGLRLEVLLDEVAITSAQHPSGEQIREHLQFCQDRGLASTKAGLIGETRYFITEAGSAAYQETP